MTFADRNVRNALASFALTWKNIQDDPSCGASYRHSPGEPATALLRGIGNHNVQILFLTPDAKLLHILAGYWPAKDLLREIDFVRTLLANLKKGKEKLAALHHAHSAEDEKMTDAADGALTTVDLEESGCVTGWKTSHAYMADHVLIPLEEFRASDLVGEGTSFFGAVTATANDTVKPERISERSDNRVKKRKP